LNYFRDDDEISDNFIYKRIHISRQGDYDITVFNGDCIRVDGKGTPVPFIQIRFILNPLPEING